MSNFKFAKPGLNAVGQYQLSGIPYATASLPVPVVTDNVTELTFPTVTKFVTVINTHAGPSSAKLRVGFSDLGVSTNDHYFVLDNGESYTGEFRIASIYLAGDTTPSTASVIAGLTMIELENLRSNWSGSEGTELYNGGLG